VIEFGLRTYGPMGTSHTRDFFQKVSQIPHLQVLRMNLGRSENGESTGIHESFIEGSQIISAETWNYLGNMKNLIEFRLEGTEAISFDLEGSQSFFKALEKLQKLRVLRFCLNHSFERCPNEGF